MSNFNSPRGRDEVVGIDDVAVASSVIKALRSSSNSNRHYKQNASRDDHLINDIDHFNKIVIVKSQEVSKANAKEQQINEVLANYIPPAQPMTIMNNSPCERKNRQVRQQMSFSLQQCRCSRNYKLHTFLQEMKRSTELDSDSDEAENNFSPPKLSDTFDDSQDPRDSYSYSQSKRAAHTASKADLDFGSDDDDDPAEMAELMRNFIAPSTTGSGKVGNKAQSYKGSSSNTSSSIKYGAGGIRGIQHQRLQQSGERDVDDDQSINTSASMSYSTNSAVSAATASKLMLIKPGQAIRVKAPNKKSRSNNMNNNLNGSIGIG